MTTERHLLKFYFSIALGFVFFVLMGSFMIKLFFQELSKGQSLKIYFLLIFGVGCVFLAVYTLVRYFKNSPNISVDKSQIQFNDEVFLWEDLAGIELTGKKPFRYVVTFPMEGAKFQFKDGQIKFFFDDMYSNSWQLKSFIQQIVIDKKESVDTSANEIVDSGIRLEQFETFRGNQFTSLRGISLWGLFAFFIIIMISKNKVPPGGFWIFIFFFGSFWFFINSYLMNYFEVSNKYLVVKNHNLIWKNKVYLLNNIKEVVFETQGKMPNCLRVITKDFRNKLYPAGTLRDSNWIDLGNKLEQNGITVRNECI